MNTAQLLPQVQHLASFAPTINRLIGAIRRRIILQQFPTAEIMLAIAAEVGYSETVFALRSKTALPCAPAVEVPFFMSCYMVALGHHCAKNTARRFIDCVWGLVNCSRLEQGKFRFPHHLQSKLQLIKPVLPPMA